MATQRGVGVVIMVVVAGLAVGSWLGELVGGLLSPGPVQDVFTHGPTIGLTSPAVLDLRFLALTFGLAFKINLVGVVGIVIAAFALRRL